MESPANTLTMLRLLNDSLDFGSPLPNAGSCEKIENRLLPALSVRRGTAVPRARATLDRGRESRSSPSLRTVRADLPHTALQSVVLPHRGLTDLSRWVI